MRDLDPEITAEAISDGLLPLRVEGLGFAAAGQALLDGITFTLAGTGITVIMGPNGAGKSLLLRLLHGLIAPDTGSIRWAGQPPSPAVTRRQALVFQKPVLLRRSAAANVDFVLRSRRRADPARRNALLDHVGLAGKAGQPARLLSGGEQQRLALARALATEPEVLLLDEPSASLDPASVQKIEQIVRDAAATGTRIIFVTHDVGQAKRLDDDVIFLHRGRLAEHSSGPSFFHQPQSEAARAFLEGQLLV